MEEATPPNPRASVHPQRRELEHSKQRIAPHPPSSRPWPIFWVWCGLPLRFLCWDPGPQGRGIGRCGTLKSWDLVGSHSDTSQDVNLLPVW